VGGSGYFRTRAVQRHLAEGRLRRVKKAPAFSYAAHAAYSTQTDAALIAWALAALVESAKESNTLSDASGKLVDLEP
jgi:LysR family transcriptional regulator, flagellar master operon regulator